MMKLREMVEAAAVWLDAEKPGWEALINCETLDMENPCYCIIGQTFQRPGHFTELADTAPVELREAFLGVGAPADDFLDLSRGDWTEYARGLETLWVDEIKARFN